MNKKYYCPCCSLPLRGNKVGDGHISEIEAWDAHECEYSVGDPSNKPKYTHPIKEIDLQKGKLVSLKTRRKLINKLIREKNKMIEELEG